MKTYALDILAAAVLYPLVAALFTLPYVIRQYRKYGYIPWTHTIMAYTFILYLMCAFSLIVLPLPSDPSAIVAHQPRLQPFSFVHQIIAECTSAYAQTGSKRAVLAVPVLYQTAFNLLLTIPLGMYLRYFFQRSWLQALLIGFCTSLFFETTQLTGDWFIYPAAYRLFDVDDLIVNTTGTMLGYMMMMPLAHALPSMHMAKYETADKSLRASATHRLVSFGIDTVLAAAIWGVIALAAGAHSHMFEAFASGSFTGSRMVKLAVFSFVPIQAILLCIVPCITGGQTLGQKILKLRMVRPNGSRAARWQYVARYLLLLAFLYLPIILLRSASLLENIGDTSQALDMSTLISFIGRHQTELLDSWRLFLVLWLASLLLRAAVARASQRPMVMLNGLLSGTRVMTAEGAEEAQDRQRVISVAEVTAWEQDLAANGTSLSLLMERAGRGVAEKVAQNYYTQLDGRRRRINRRYPVVILAGSGNNGGDGWVAARYLAQAGFPVTLVTRRSAEQITAQPARGAAMQTASGNLPIDVLVNPNPEQLQSTLSSATTIIDAILGTGFTGATVREPYATWIELANNRRSSALKRNGKPRYGKTPAFMLAVDVPSGMNAQDGSVAVPCIQADLTVTMLAYKPGLVAKTSAPYTGAVRLAPLVRLRS